MHIGLKFIVCLDKGLFIFHATLAKVVAGSLQLAHQVLSLTRVTI